MVCQVQMCQILIMCQIHDDVLGPDEVSGPDVSDPDVLGPDGV